MPYNTTAIPPRKEVTGQTQLPLTRVKKIIAVDPEINICSNNAAFVITLATEMFIQHLASEAQNMAKAERKPRRNIQYKDLASAVMHHDNLEFLEDVIPKTAPYKQVKAQAAATRAALTGEKTASGDGGAAGAGGASDGRDDPAGILPNGKKHKSLNGTASASGGVNGFGGASTGGAASRARILLSEEDPNAQLEMEMMQAQQTQGSTQQQGSQDGDVDMTG